MKPYYEHGGITIYHGDCREVLPLLERVDHVIMDPPYSEHVHSKSRAGTSLPDVRGSQKRGVTRLKVSRARVLGFESLDPELQQFVAAQVARICQRWVLVFSDLESVHTWQAALETPRQPSSKKAALEHVRMGVWVKIGATPQFTGDRPATGAEAIEIAHRPGRKKWNGGGTHAVWEYPIVLNRSGADPRLHTTQKPLRLMERLVALFTDPGDLVLDSFGGSGTTAHACKNLGRRCIMIEREESHCEKAARRLSQEIIDWEAA